jgi:maltokinase
VSGHLSAAVAAADPSLVLPVRPRGAQVAVPGPLALVDALDLGGGHAVAVVDDAAGARWTVPLVVGAEGVRRSHPGDGTAGRLVARLGSGSGAADRFALTAWHHTDARGERGVTVDQTNESVVVGDLAVVKWTLHLPRPGEPGSPAPRRLRALAAAGFRGTPEPWGLLEHDGVLLAAVVQFLPGALDGWDWAVDDVRRLARGELTMAAALAGPKRIGMLAAAMHVALAAAGRHAASATQLREWADAAQTDLAEAVSLVEGEEGDRLRRWSPAISTALESFAGTAGTPLIEVHGDLHVGQVLRHGTPPDYAVTDFDGNPVLPATERGRRQPAALDVAGMLASLDHVGRVVVRRTEGIDPEVVHEWIHHAQRAFLHDYRDTLARQRSADLLDDRLLAPMRLAQEVREYLYAVRHLPHWTYVPDGALADLMTHPT